MALDGDEFDLLITAHDGLVELLERRLPPTEHVAARHFLQMACDRIKVAAAVLCPEQWEEYRAEPLTIEASAYDGIEHDPVVRALLEMPTENRNEAGFMLYVIPRIVRHLRAKGLLR